MTNRKLATAFVVFVLALPASGFGQAKPLEMKWSELAPMVTGHQLTVTVSDGTAVKGEAVAVREDSLLLDVSSSAKGYPKGSGSIPRNSIVMIDLYRTKGAWGRTLGTVIGVLGGIALGAYVDAKNLWNSSAGQEVGTFVGIAAGGAVGGYFAGRAIDNRVTHIRIVP